MVIVDTNILMNPQAIKDVFEDFENITIPVEVLAELDNLKTKEGQVGYNAREAIRNLKENLDDLNFLVTENVENYNRKHMLVDDIILKHCEEFPNALLLTNDFNMEIKAKSKGIKSQNYFGSEREEVRDVYYVEMRMDQYNSFLEKGDSPLLDEVPVGQFARILSPSNQVLGDYRYLGPGMWDIVADKKEIKTHIYDVKARDVHQRCAIKSLKTDAFTVLTGPAGSGKTLLALAECLRRMNKNGSTVHIFVNPVKTRDTEQLGYYPGSKDEKLMSNFIGGILSSKMGDVIEVERLLHTGALKIHPFSDIRGIEIKAGDVMYITEAQNLSIDLIKLAIQRCADGSKIIIEGDYKAQVDKRQFEGHNNGLQRVIEVFTGTTACDFGYVNLPHIYRSKMAEKAEEL